MKTELDFSTCPSCKKEMTIGVMTFRWPNQEAGGEDWKVICQKCYALALLAITNKALDIEQDKIDQMLEAGGQRPTLLGS